MPANFCGIQDRDEQLTSKDEQKDELSLKTLAKFLFEQEQTLKKKC